MKKALSLLIALLTASSVSVMAFAADDNPGTYYADDIGGVAGRSIAPFASSDYDDEDETINASIAAGEIVLIDEDGKVAGINNVLTPDTEYTFRIHVADSAISIPSGTTLPAGAVTKELKGENIRNADGTYGKLRLRTVKGSSMISSAKIEKRGSNNAATYRLVVTTRPSSTTKLTEVQYRIDTTGYEAPTGTPASGDYNEESIPIPETTHDFRVGYRTISDDLTDVDEGGTLTIDNDNPVITKSQFSDIAKSSNYRNIWLEAEDGAWRYYGRVSGMGDTNFTWSHDAIPAIMNALDDQDFKFLTFRSGVTFPTNGEMRIDVSDVSPDFDRIYTYMYRDGKLTLVNTEYDATNDEIVFRTNYLGSFIITDKAITGDILDTGNTDKDKDTDDDEDDDDDDDDVLTPGGGAGTGTENPGMGANSAANAAVALGVVSLATAGVVIRKRK